MSFKASKEGRKEQHIKGNEERKKSTKKRWEMGASKKKERKGEWKKSEWQKYAK